VRREERRGQFGDLLALEVGRVLPPRTMQILIHVEEKKNTSLNGTFGFSGTRDPSVCSM